MEPKPRGVFTKDSRVERSALESLVFTFSQLQQLAALFLFLFFSNPARVSKLTASQHQPQTGRQKLRLPAVVVSGGGFTNVLHTQLGSQAPVTQQCQKVQAKKPVSEERTEWSAVKS